MTSIMTIMSTLRLTSFLCIPVVAENIVLFKT